MSNTDKERIEKPNIIGFSITKNEKGVTIAALNRDQLVSLIEYADYAESALTSAREEIKLLKANVEARSKMLDPYRKELQQLREENERLEKERDEFAIGFVKWAAESGVMRPDIWVKGIPDNLLSKYKKTLPE